MSDYTNLMRYKPLVTNVNVTWRYRTYLAGYHLQSQVASLAKAGLYAKPTLSLSGSTLSIGPFGAYVRDISYNRGPYSLVMISTDVAQGSQYAFSLNLSSLSSYVDTGISTRYHIILRYEFYSNQSTESTSPMFLTSVLAISDSDFSGIEDWKGQVPDGVTVYRDDICELCMVTVSKGSTGTVSYAVSPSENTCSYDRALLMSDIPQTVTGSIRFESPPVLVSPAPIVSGSKLMATRGQLYSTFREASSDAKVGVDGIDYSGYSIACDRAVNCVVG